MQLAASRGSPARMWAGPACSHGVLQMLTDSFLMPCTRLFGLACSMSFCNLDRNSLFTSKRTCATSAHVASPPVQKNRRQSWAPPKVVRSWTAVYSSTDVAPPNDPGPLTQADFPGVQWQTDDPLGDNYWPSDLELWQWMEQGWVDWTVRFGFTHL